ncbi:DNA-directed RNA polymerase I subunit RPA12 [Atheta coriaria]|uniref:DNA-directed RNA polymerase I subunit RPA12 n=1 Tax=Dalotia coriaria TaxID=877792 RepID=UPI0031F4479F
MTTKTTFRAPSGICTDCGSILPLVQRTGNICCYTCKKEYPVDVFGDQAIQYTINFNSLETCKKQQDSENQQKNKKGDEDEEEGPVVERKCPKCDNNRMSYATLQLRSADEGQTVFYTCTKCKFKETENS